MRKTWGEPRSANTRPGLGLGEKKGLLLNPEKKSASTQSDRTSRGFET